jgi:glucose/arabinose dehydrogenase
MAKQLSIYVAILFFFLTGKSFAQSNYYQEDRWPNLRFILPVEMIPAPDQSKRIFVLEQNGRIKVFKDSGNVAQNDTSTFLNIRSKLPLNFSTGNETGLLGMAFHPNYNQNGYVFINYCTTNPVVTFVSRFTLDPTNSNRLDPTTEKIILQVSQPFSNHNAGSMLFGDDGYLYVTMGDGGSGGDPGNRSQNRGVLLGKILRINVNVPDNGPPYSIPADNPLVGNNQNWREEIYAWGLRNPWKISKDANSSTIWIADVGQNAFEEIDTLRRAANYGWKILEGNSAYSTCNNCDTSNLENPLVTYGRSLGISVTGGFVYRGEELYKLKGAYIYGDYGSRRIWSLQKDETGVFQNTQIATADGSISSFGLDNDGELYAVRYASTNGKLMKMRCGPPTPVLVTPLNPTVCIGDSIVIQAPITIGINGFRWSTGDTTRKVKITAEGVYNLSLQTRNEFGCWSYSSTPLRLAVVPFPQKPIVPNVTVCPGDSAMVTLPGNLNYIWSAGGIQNNFSSSQPGQYWVISKDPEAGCPSDTGYFSVNNFQQSATPGLAIAGNQLTASSINAITFEWYLDGIFLEETITPNLTANQSGSYTVIGISVNGCRSTASQPVIFTSVHKELEESGEFTLSPNPANEKIVINNASSTDFMVAILNSDGRTVQSVTLSSGKNV